MKVRFCVLIALAGAMISCFLAGPAYAVKAFKDEFEAKYVKTDSAAPAAAVQQARCNICHLPKSKSLRNAYGQALGELLDREKDQDDKARIAAALEEVANKKANPSDPKSPTFGQRIKQGKLPCEP
jgi:cytochrome c2